MTRTSDHIAAPLLEVAGLRRALDTRARIEQAKGMLMLLHVLQGSNGPAGPGVPARTVRQPGRRRVQLSAAPGETAA